MIARPRATATRLDAQKPHLAVTNERIEHASGVAAAADASHDEIRQPADTVERLLPSLAADDRLKIADNSWEGVRPDNRADDVMRSLDAGHPISEGLVDRVAECP